MRSSWGAGAAVLDHQRRTGSGRIDPTARSTDSGIAADASTILFAASLALLYLWKSKLNVLAVIVGSALFGLLLLA